MPENAEANANNSDKESNYTSDDSEFNDFEED